jgi:hypothetical protein
MNLSFRCLDLAHMSWYGSTSRFNQLYLTTVLRLNPSSLIYRIFRTAYLQPALGVQE